MEVAERQADMEELPKYLQSFTRGYKHRYHFFEILVMMKKLALVGLPVLIGASVNEQLFFGLIASFIFCAPYPQTWRFLLQTLALIASESTLRG